MAAARTMGFTAVVSYESPSRTDPAGLHDRVRGHPGAARQAEGDYVRRRSGLEFYYDGKTMTAFVTGRKPRGGLPTPRPRSTRAESGLRLCGDLLSVHRRDRRRPLQGHRRWHLELAFYIGRSRWSGETTTDMVAYARQRHVLFRPGSAPRTNCLGWRGRCIRNEPGATAPPAGPLQLAARSFTPRGRL